MKSNKQRINISVDPSVHERFALYAERTNQSVSGILNEVMDLYCPDGDGKDIATPVLLCLRQRLLAQDWAAFQRIVRKLALDAGLQEICWDDTSLEDPCEIPPEYRTEWVGVVGKTKIGLQLAMNLSREPDITLGRALLFRGTHQCERVLLVVPYRQAIPSKVLAVVAQAGLEAVGVDLLETALRSRSRRESPVGNGDPL